MMRFSDPRRDSARAELHVNSPFGQWAKKVTISALFFVCSRYLNISLVEVLFQSQQLY